MTREQIADAVLDLRLRVRTLDECLREYQAAVEDPGYRVPPAVEDPRQMRLRAARRIFGEMGLAGHFSQT